MPNLFPTYVRRRTFRLKVFSKLECQGQARVETDFVRNSPLTISRSVECDRITAQSGETSRLVPSPNLSRGSLGGIQAVPVSIRRRALRMRFDKNRRALRLR